MCYVQCLMCAICTKIRNERILGISTKKDMKIYYYYIVVCGVKYIFH